MAKRKAEEKKPEGLEKMQARSPEASEDGAAEVVRAPPAPEPQKKEPAAKVVPIRTLPKVSARVYISAKGIRFDQAVPFLKHAERRNMAQRTIPEWDQAWDGFQNRPVK